MRLVLLRHARTLENQRGIIQGHTPGRISPRGAEATRGVARALRGMGHSFEAIYTSDLRRAWDTARLLSPIFGDIPIRATPLLRERGYGALEGKTRRQTGIDYNSLYGRDFPHLGVEPIHRVLERARALRRMLLESGHRRVLAVGHGGFNSYFTNLVLGEGTRMHPVQLDASLFEFDGQGEMTAYRASLTGWSGTAGY